MSGRHRGRRAAEKSSGRFFAVEKRPSFVILIHLTSDDEGGREEEKNLKMSQHTSLKGSGKITAKRNVLKRFERVNVLKKRGQWKDGDRGLGLRKTKPDV